jgi:anti-anti-sigma factor
MLLELASDWTIELERGPDWLFVRLRSPRQGDTHEVNLAETVWDKMEQSFTSRVVLEMDEVRLLRSWMIGELVKLHKRVCAAGGMMRLCGLSDSNQDVLRLCRLEDRFPQYRTRTDAVMGHRPPQPR